jgi:hypothetical protein
MSCSNEDTTVCCVLKTHCQAMQTADRLWQTLFARTPDKIVLSHEVPYGIRYVRPLFAPAPA